MFVPATGAAPHGWRHRKEFSGMLESLVRLIEHESRAMRCSILLLDADGVTLRHGAAPNLPADYCAAIDGLRIGPHVGSCGTAAFHDRTTIVADIAADPLWEAFRGLALPAGLRACWSTPIHGAAGEVLGTFAMYYDEPRAPEPRDLARIDTAALLAGAIIERELLLHQTESDRAALADANATLEEQQVELETANQQLQESAVELEALNQQLHENAVELEQQAQALEQANRAKSDFLATMSHELRTPLNAIAGYADLLLAGVRGELTPEQRGDVQRMKRSGDHLLGLINDILNFARLEAGSIEFHLGELRVAPLLDTLEELIRPQVDARSLHYTQALASRDLVARGDAEKVRQVLLNLVTNAVKFTEPGGAIHVECDGDPECVRFAVRDTGRGIPEQHLKRIFDPFVQVDRELTPRSQQGVGLGLSISRDLARGMGGSLTATSRPGAGSTFVLTLPRLSPVAITGDAAMSIPGDAAMSIPSERERPGIPVEGFAPPAEQRPLLA
ncbi:MAG TPA: ATP-binding protein [Gemmatimonadaceae bacterium]